MRKSYFNIFSIPNHPPLRYGPRAQRSLSQPTEKTPKNFFHSFRMCCSTKKSKFSYCGFIPRFFNYNVAYSCCERAFRCVLWVCSSCLIKRTPKNCNFHDFSATDAAAASRPPAEHHRVFVEPHRRVCLSKNFVITFRASAIIMEMIHLLLH